MRSFSVWCYGSDWGWKKKTFTLKKLLWGVPLYEFKGFNKGMIHNKAYEDKEETKLLGLSST